PGKDVELIMNADGTNVRDLPNEYKIKHKNIRGEFAIIPNGNIVFLQGYYQDTGSYHEVYIMDTASRRSKRLTNLGGYLRDLSVSPDGEKILFLFNTAGIDSRGKGQIYVLNIDGSGLKMIRNNY
ncbi:MAG: hypothetical protein QME64_12325, partial [bacterium]|nr:hypothetical protein [bacterium]